MSFRTSGSEEKSCTLACVVSDTDKIHHVIPNERERGEIFCTCLPLLVIPTKSTMSFRTSNSEEKSFEDASKEFIILGIWNHNYYVYMTTNYDKSILYIGVTNDLSRRLYEHKENKGTAKSFTGRYYCYYLVYYEHFTNIEHAIEREKEIKKWRREKKDALINATNSDWRFLNDEID